MTWPRPTRGRSADMLANPLSNVMIPNMSWKYTADSPMVAMARAMPAAMGMPAAPHRVDGDRSATTTIGAVPGCS